MKKAIISFCIVTFAVATFTSCQKETSQPSNILNAGTASNIIKSKSSTKYTGSTGTSDSTQTKTNP